MSTARFGRKWADVDEDDEDAEGGQLSSQTGATRFETGADEHGVKTVIEYVERNGKTYKVTKKVKQTSVTKWTNAAMAERKNIKKFGKPAMNPAAEAALIVRAEDEVNIEITRRPNVSLSTKDDAEDKWLEESFKITENLFKEKKVWTDINRDKQMDRDEAATKDKPAETAATPAAGNAASAPDDGKSKYVPPSLRNSGKDGGKDGGKGKDNGAEASLRITNLSQDVREGDLQELFGQFGRLQRVYLAKDMQTFESKGFAFVTYFYREEAQKAIDKLNGHGYDNLIMQVQWAKPRQ